MPTEKKLMRYPGVRVTAGRKRIVGLRSSAQLTRLIPFKDMEQWIEGFNVTKTEDRFYWHVHISKENKKMILHRKKGHGKIDLSKYLLTEK